MPGSSHIVAVESVEDRILEEDTPEEDIPAGMLVAAYRYDTLEGRIRSLSGKGIGVCDLGRCKKKSAILSVRLETGD